MAYGHLKDLAIGIVHYNILCDKKSNIAKTPKYNGSLHKIPSMVYKYFDKTCD